MHLAKQLYFSFLFLFLVNYTAVFSEVIPVSVPKLKLKECLLPADHPLQDQLKDLFDHSHMFSSPAQLSDSGFQVINRVHRGLMVARHPALKNCLIKKFQDKVPQDSQLRNYLRRINGARALSRFIQTNHLQHIVVPQKWLYPLPKRFSNSNTGKITYILIVEEIDICKGGKDPDGEVARRYYTIDFEILRELCYVVYYFRGLDSMLHNMPFTYQNKIAFIDTERWEWQREGYLRRAMPYMSKDRQKYALAVFEELEALD